MASWGSLKQELLPNIDFPIITVIAPYPGAGTADVAEQVAAPIEAAVASVAGVESLRSVSTTGLGFVSAQFAYGSDVKEIVRQIRLRDLGGIIVIDFIDMDERKNRQKVMMALDEALRSDRAPMRL